MNFREWIEDKINRNKNRTFLIFEGVKRETWEEFGRNLNRAANAFLQVGIQKGDIVVMLCSNSPENLYSWFGLLKIGAIDLPLNTEYKGPLLKGILERSQPKAIVIDEDIYTSIYNDIEGVANKIIISEKEIEIKEPATYSLKELMKKSSEENPPPVEIKNDDIMDMMTTAGTTGPPKLCMITHNHQIVHAEKWAKFQKISPEDTVYCPMPLYHQCRNTGCLTAIAAEASFATDKRFSASKFWDRVREVYATVIIGHFAVPKILMQQPEKPSDKDHPVRAYQGIFGYDVDRFRERFGIKEIYTTYGSTEAGWPAKILCGGGYTTNVCGYIDEDYEVKIFNENDEEVPDGNIGEIVIRPKKPNIMFKGYYKMPEQTLEAFRNLWFHSGDIGFIKNGILNMVQRKAESIRRKGEFIPILEIEEMIRSHPKILDVGICGVPDEVSGEEIKACIVPREKVTPEELFAFFEKTLPRFAIPRYIEFMDELPRVPGTQKLQRYKLKERGIEKAWDRKNMVL